MGYSNRSQVKDKMGINNRGSIELMPVNSHLYPKNWHDLAKSIKESANWQCQCCGKRCYEPGQRPKNLTRSEWTADILQVHHLNHDTTDNRLSNLLAVCATCHLSLHRGSAASFACKRR